MKVVDNVSMLRVRTSRDRIYPVNRVADDDLTMNEDLWFSYPKKSWMLYENYPTVVQQWSWPISYRRDRLDWPSRDEYLRGMFWPENFHFWRVYIWKWRYFTIKYHVPGSFFCPSSHYWKKNIFFSSSSIRSIDHFPYYENILYRWFVYEKNMSRRRRQQRFSHRKKHSSLDTPKIDVN